MTREEIFNSCADSLSKRNCLLMEMATGLGKTALSLKLTNHLLSNQLSNHKGECINVLILVAKRVHKQTWREEIEKWGGIHHERLKVNICMECYESLKNHCKEHWDVIIADEVHHIGSELRLDFLRTMSFKFFIGLSATIPRKTKQIFRFRYHAQIVSCDITEAIENDILPEPQILLFPLKLDNTTPSEQWEINPNAKGQTYYDDIKNIWQYKKKRQHAILSCTPLRYLAELNTLILWQKNIYMRSRNTGLEKRWLHLCGKRLEFLANQKNPTIKDILTHLKKERTITFCKTIEQCEELGSYCIHSQNKDTDATYHEFNQKKIDHITAVNILNENANLVDCKYAVFANLSSSEVVIPQRLGKL